MMGCFFFNVHYRTTAVQDCTTTLLYFDVVNVLREFNRTWKRENVHPRWGSVGNVELVFAGRLT